MRPGTKAVLVGKERICITMVIDFLNIVELSVQGNVLSLTPKEYPLRADVRIFPLFKFTESAYSIWAHLW